MSQEYTEIPDLQVNEITLIEAGAGLAKHLV